MCKKMGGYRSVRTWEDADVCVHGRMQMYKDMGKYMGGCRCARIWVDANVYGHGRIQMCN